MHQKDLYCATKEPENEFRDMIKAMHKAGIQCIMEFYFPKGTNPLMALQASWFWKTYYHVDGFHFIGEGVPVELLAKESHPLWNKEAFSVGSGLYGNRQDGSRISGRFPAGYAPVSEK